MRWDDFEKAAPEIALTGKSLLYRPDRGEVAIMATVDGNGKPRVAPVAPIFCEGGVYLSVGSHTPKVHHLRNNGWYAMHAMVGADDLEFQMAGTVCKVESPTERNAVVSAIPFPSYDANDPIFELLVERALMVTWPQRSTHGKKTVWSKT
jgi:uncharacterized pyridoxamine 5'-phosphate oxidase family protein